MRRTLAVPALAALLLACSTGHSGEHAGARAAFKDLAIKEAADLQKAKAAVFLDANGDDFRKQNGVVPGATLLASVSKYDLNVLPQDKGSKLVFYCANRH